MTMSGLKPTISLIHHHPIVTHDLIILFKFDKKKLWSVLAPMVPYVNEKKQIVKMES